jgi:hypothetical protein
MLNLIAELNNIEHILTNQSIHITYIVWRRDRSQLNCSRAEGRAPGTAAKQLEVVPGSSSAVELRRLILSLII